LSLSNAKEALERDLERVQEAWDDSQADRRRDAIYGYLKAVYDLVNWWSAERCEVDRARQARSKWGRVLRYAKREKDEEGPLAEFIKRKGGINECNARYGRCLRRLAATRRSIAGMAARPA
jgi:hypothetical protein